MRARTRAWAWGTYMVETYPHMIGICFYHIRPSLRLAGWLAVWLAGWRWDRISPKFEIIKIFNYFNYFIFLIILILEGLAGWLAGCLAGWLAGCLAGHLELK